MKRIPVKPVPLAPNAIAQRPHRQRKRKEPWLPVGNDRLGRPVERCLRIKEKSWRLGVSIFHAGVKETEKERDAPKNQARCTARSMMRSIRRRAERKRRLRALLVKEGLLPECPEDFDRLVRHNRWPLPETQSDDDKDRTVWHLRAEALERELDPFEFGRVLVHLNQSRGALGVETDEDATDEGKIKDEIDNLKGKLDGRTIGVRRGLSSHEGVDAGKVQSLVRE